MTDWQTDRLIDWNCVAVSVIDWLTDWLKGLVSKEQWGNETPKFGMILHVNSGGYICRRPEGPSTLGGSGGMLPLKILKF